MDPASWCRRGWWRCGQLASVVGANEWHGRADRAGGMAVTAFWPDAREVPEQQEKEKEKEKDAKQKRFGGFRNTTACKHGRREPGVFSHASSFIVHRRPDRGLLLSRSLARGRVGTNSTRLAWASSRKHNGFAQGMMEGVLFAAVRGAQFPAGTAWCQRTHNGCSGQRKKKNTPHMDVGGDLDGSCAAMASTVSGSTPHSASRFGFGGR